MSQSDQPAAAKPGAPVLIPAGKTFTPDEITFFKDKGTRTLEQAIAEADLLVSCPHSGDAVPAELAEFLAPEFTQRLQFDYSDRTTGPVVRAWAQVDPRIIYVENPHPRLLRDPNRPRPANLGAQLREAFNRVRDAGAWNKVDLTGVDTIRPVTFSFFPLLRVPDSDAELEAMVKAFESVAERGLGVYESTRNSIRNAMVAAASERVKNGGRALVTTLSFHDTMNHTTTRDGAVNVLRAPADQLPDVVALSNRGDGQGNRRGEDVITMDAEALRALADCHRTGFDVAFDADVALNTPYLGSQEIIASGRTLQEPHRFHVHLGVGLGDRPTRCGAGRVPARIPAGTHRNRRIAAAGHRVARRRHRVDGDAGAALHGQLERIPRMVRIAGGLTPLDPAALTTCRDPDDR